MPSLAPNWKCVPKHWSTWLGVATIIADSAYVFIDAAAASMSPQTVIMLNAAAAVAMKILQLLKQDIPITPEIKTELIEAVKSAPTPPPPAFRSGGILSPTEPPSPYYPGHVPPQTMPAPAPAPVTMREYIDRAVALQVSTALAAKRPAKSRPPKSGKTPGATLPAEKGGEA